jgi:hypothetical protein
VAGCLDVKAEGGGQIFEKCTLKIVLIVIRPKKKPFEDVVTFAGRGWSGKGVPSSNPEIVEQNEQGKFLSRLEKNQVAMRTRPVHQLRNARGFGIPGMDILVLVSISAVRLNTRDFEFARRLVRTRSSRSYLTLLMRRSEMAGGDWRVRTGPLRACLGKTAGS